MSIKDNLMHAAFDLANTLWRKGDGMVVRFHFFSQREGCEYTDLARDGFYDGEYRDVRAAFLILLDRFRELEGDDFGR